jgi:hypothetical protein
MFVDRYYFVDGDNHCRWLYKILDKQGLKEFLKYLDKLDWVLLSGQYFILIQVLPFEQIQVRMIFFKQTRVET